MHLYKLIPYQTGNILKMILNITPSGHSCLVTTYSTSLSHTILVKTPINLVFLVCIRAFEALARVFGHDAHRLWELLRAVHPSVCISVQFVNYVQNLLQKQNTQI